MLALEKTNFKIFISGEVWHEVGEPFRTCMNTIEPEINQCIKGGNYGSGCVEWAYIAIILNEEIEPYCKERNIFWHKKQEFEFRLKIDYEKFKNGDRRVQFKLFSESILRSIQLMRKKKIKDFDIDRLEQDVTECLAKYL